MPSDKVTIPLAIVDFVAAVVLASRNDLSKRDEDFVRLLDELTLAYRAGLQHPNWSAKHLPKPKERLPKEWHDLLETTYDLYQQARTICTILNLLADLESRPRGIETGQRLELFSRDWNIHSQALVEKAIFAAERSIRRSTLDRARKKEISSTRIEALRSMDSRLRAVRDPLLHGAGGAGVIARGVTEDQGWEATVALKQTMADIEDGISIDLSERVTEYSRVLHQRSEETFDVVSESLRGVLVDIGWVTDPAA